MKKPSLKRITALLVSILFLVACGQQPSPPPSSDNNEIQVINVNTGDIITNDITQIKVFDQCQSSGSVQAQISFNEISSTQTGEQLVLGGSVGGEIGLSVAAKVTIEGSIQKQYSSQQAQSFGRQESINIEVPGNTKQQYTIVWTEYRQGGSVEYSENGQTKSVPYDYRLGVQLSSSSVTNLDCPGSSVAIPVPPTSQPSQATASPQPIPTIAPLYPLSNNGAAEGNGLQLTATVLCMVNCGGSQFSEFEPLINIQYRLTNTSQQMIIVPKFGGDESYIQLNTGQQLYVWTSIGWCDRDAYIDSQSLGPGESIKWEWGYKFKNNQCGGYGAMLPMPDSATSFTIVFPAVGERFGGANWTGTIPR
jgi:hypothetical protein